MKHVRQTLAGSVVLSLALAAGSAAAQDQVLTVWTHEFPPLQQALLDKWIPEFEAANPGVEIELTTIPFAGVISYDTKLVAALESGAGPDLWDMGSWVYDDFIEAGYIEPLDPMAFGYESAEELVSDYPPGAMEVFLDDEGNVYALFSELNTLALFYNKRMFEAAGIEPLPDDDPVSWERIGEIGQQLRKVDPSTGALQQTGYQFGFFAAFRSPQWYAQNYYALLRQYGQNDLFVDGTPAADTEAAVNAFQVIYDFTHEHQAYDPNFLSNWFADFPNDRVAMVLAGQWFAPAIRNEDPDVEFGVVPHPVVDPGVPDTMHNIVWSWGWSINAASEPEAKELAQDFMVFMLGKKDEVEQPAAWFESTGYLQPRAAFTESEEFEALVEAEPWLQQFPKAFAAYDAQYVQHSYDEAGAALVRAIDRIIYDGMSAEETAELLQRELERL